jgi:lipopolysaccharide/colanic/teichoic acid biosynthesis glycosyltransferase
MHDAYELQKRLVDIGVASLALCLSAPVVVAAALLVKLGSEGPLLYRSRRVGKGWREFDLLKLRTMKVEQTEGAPQVTSGSDERITRVGRLLRRLKVDELPQLINVLRGEVSLVGPRPEVMRYASRYREKYDIVLTMKPGLTDRATLAHIDEESELAASQDPETYYLDVVLPRKIEMYLEYIENQNMLEDLAILAATGMKLLGRITGR